MKPVELRLTCKDQAEAQAIADALLEKRLIACAEFIPVTSRFQWKGEIEQSDEIKLVMLSQMQHFDEVETEVKRLHSYETFVLKAIPIERLNEDAKHWLAGATSPDV